MRKIKSLIIKFILRKIKHNMHHSKYYIQLNSAIVEIKQRLIFKDFKNHKSLNNCENSTKNEYHHEKTNKIYYNFQPFII